MISYLEGTVEYRGDRFVVVNAGGVGYRVTVIPKVLNSIAKTTDEVNPSAKLRVKLFVHAQLNMREGTFDLYGFDLRQDLELFGLLTSVSGIGPKNAMHILASVEGRHLKAAIVNEDADYLCKTSNLGPKTAKRLVLELKNKVDYLDLGDMKGVDLDQESQATEALLALGYSLTQAKDALKLGSKKTKNLQERVKEALKVLGRR